MCAQCNIWTFCNPDTGDGCDTTCVASQFNFDSNNPNDPARFGQGYGCTPGGEWPKCAQPDMLLPVSCLSPRLWVGCSFALVGQAPQVRHAGMHAHSTPISRA